MKKRFFITSVLILGFSLLMVQVFASPLSFGIDKFVIFKGENVTISGASSTGSVDIDITLPNKTVISYTEPVTNEIFSKSFSETNQHGEYLIQVSDSIGSLSGSFKVVANIRIKAMPIQYNATELFKVHTGNTSCKMDAVFKFITYENNTCSYYKTTHSGQCWLANNSEDYYVMDFNDDGDNGDYIYMLLVDSDSDKKYDTVYIDDDTDFNVSDSETDGFGEYILRKGEPIIIQGEDIGFIIRNIDKKGRFAIAAMLPRQNPVTGEPESRPPYHPGDTERELFIVTNSTGHPVNNTPINVTVFDPDTGEIMFGPEVICFTNEWGWCNGTVSIGNWPAKKYVKYVNDGAFITTIPVKSFFIVTNFYSGEDREFSFDAGDTVTIKVAVKYFNGTAITGASVEVEISDPDGIKSTVSLTETSTGFYEGTFSDTYSTGMYRAKITATYSNKKEREFAFFEVRGFDVIVLPIEDAKKGPTTGFAPDSEGKLVVLATSGDFEPGPEGPPEPSAFIPLNCSIDIVYIVFRDSEGEEIELSYDVDQFSEFPVACQINFTTPNVTGMYFAEVGIQLGDETVYGGTSFVIQELVAWAHPISESGEYIWRVSPGLEVRMRVEAYDLKTEKRIDYSNITSVNVMEVRDDDWELVEIPDVQYLGNGTFNFTAPNVTGFYTLRFILTANVGVTKTGSGEGSFECKLYDVWAHPTDWKPHPPGTGDVNITVEVRNPRNWQQVMSDINVFIDSVDIFYEGETKLDFEWTTKTGKTDNTSTVTISLPAPIGGWKSGWYNLEVEVYDSVSGVEDFGWGWFEVRAFNLFGQMVAAPVVGEPKEKWQFNTTEDIGLIVSAFVSGKGPWDYPPPVESLDDADIEKIVYFGTMENPVWEEIKPNVTLKHYAIPPPETGWPQDKKQFIFHLDNPAKRFGTGHYMIRFKGKVGSDEEYGETHFDVKSFILWIDWSKFKDTYAVSDVIQFNVSALTEYPSWSCNEFGCGYNITSDMHYPITGVKLTEVFNPKEGRPIEGIPDNALYNTTDCSDQAPCSLEFNISKAGLDKGEYVVNFYVNASIDGKIEKEDIGFWFRAKSFVFGVSKLIDYCDRRSWDNGLSWKELKRGEGLRWRYPEYMYLDNKTINDPRVFESYTEEIYNISLIDATSKNATIRVIKNSTSEENITTIDKDSSDYVGDLNISVDWAEFEPYKGPRAGIIIYDPDLPIIPPTGLTEFSYHKINNESYAEYLSGLADLYDESYYFISNCTYNAKQFWVSNNTTSFNGPYDIDDTFSIRGRNFNFTDGHCGWFEYMPTNNLELREWEEEGEKIYSILVDTPSLIGKKLRLFNIKELRYKWDPERSYDFNGDGDINDNWFAILTNESHNYYDTLSFSSASNDSATLDLSSLSSLNEREKYYMDAGSFYLYDINEKYGGVRLAFSELGWDIWLGDYAGGTQVFVPVYVKGTTASVRAIGYEWETPMNRSYVKDTSPYATTDSSGIAWVNMTGMISNTAMYAIYLEANTTTDKERLEDWMAPRLSLYNLDLAKEAQGDRIVNITGFSNITSSIWIGNASEESIPYVHVGSENYMGGGIILDNCTVDECDCDEFKQLPDGVANNTANCGYMGDIDLYAVYNISTQQVWIDRDSNLSDISSKSIGQTFDLNFNWNQANGTVPFQILKYVPWCEVDEQNANITTGNSTTNPDGCLVIGWNVTEHPEYEYLSHNFIGNISIDGTSYNWILFENGTWPDGRERYYDFLLSSDTNFDEQARFFGKPAADGLYLAWAWWGEGSVFSIEIANNTSIGTPIYNSLWDGIPISGDGTTAFKKINEDSLGVDWNLDGNVGDDIYFIRFTRYQDWLDGYAEQLWFDDDYDFECTGGYEDGTMEMYDRVIDGGWCHTCFAGFDYWVGDNRSEYSVINKDWTAGFLTLLRQKWDFNVSDNVTFVFKMQKFDGSPIQYANLTMLHIRTWGPYGPIYMNTSLVTVTPSPVTTDSEGLVSITLSPHIEWEQDQWHEVMFQLKTTDDKTEWINRGFGTWTQTGAVVKTGGGG